MNWSGRRVLVTGADGFIGSHLVERLVTEGADVRAFVMYNSFGTCGWLDKISAEVREVIDVVSGDVRDSKRVLDAVATRDVVFHLAALVSVPYSYQAPESFIQTNVMGTLNVLRAACQHGGMTVVHTSSSEVYGTPDTVPICETHPLRAQSPYAASKIAADKLVESFHCSYNLPTVIVRPFNTYGPRQSSRAVLPAILVQLLALRERLELGALWPRRDLTFVDDTVDGFVRAGGSDAAIGETIQLGTNRDVSIEELAKLAMHVLGVSLPIESRDERKRPAESEVRQLISDPAKARAMLGWTPTVSLEEGICRTAEWLQKNLDLYSPDRYMV